MRAPSEASKSDVPAEPEVASLYLVSLTCVSAARIRVLLFPLLQAKLYHGHFSINLSAKGGRTMRYVVPAPVQAQLDRELAKGWRELERKVGTPLPPAVRAKVEQQAFQDTNDFKEELQELVRFHRDHDTEMVRKTIAEIGSALFGTMTEGYAWQIVRKLAQELRQAPSPARPTRPRPAASARRRAQRSRYPKSDENALEFLSFLLDQGAFDIIGIMQRQFFLFATPDLWKHLKDKWNSGHHKKTTGSAMERRYRRYRGPRHADLRETFLDRAQTRLKLFGWSWRETPVVSRDGQAGTGFHAGLGQRPVTVMLELLDEAERSGKFPKDYAAHLRELFLRLVEREGTMQGAQMTGHIEMNGGRRRSGGRRRRQVAAKAPGKRST